MAKLLVSDDDHQVLELVKRVLENAGHEVVATSDPRIVHDLAKSTGADAIVLDINMPVSGFEVLGELRGDPATAALPILFLSGLGAGADRVRGLREGADDYLVKPFEPAELVLRVERLISWRASRAAPADEPAAADEVSESTDGLRFGRYKVLDVIGQGSMGTVYRGHDPRLERLVALKTIRLDAARTAAQRQELLERLRNEAITIARFSHPHIVAIYDMGDAESSAFIAMELVEGISLGEYLRLHGPLEAELLIPLGAAVASALAMAHTREVIHRDVKPGNVLLGYDGAVKVSDFGLAFILSAMADDSTQISGTPGYVPPEVMNRMAYSEPGDLFGLGATFYESLSGLHPLVGETLRETIMNTVRGDVRPLSENAAGVPEELEELVMSLLSVDPEARPSAAGVQEVLERLAAEGGLRWSPEELFS